MAKTQQDYRTIPRSQQVRPSKRQAFEGFAEYDYEVDPRTGWRFYKQHQGNLSLSSPSSSSTNWDRNTWTTRSWNSWHSSRSDNSLFFLILGPVSFDGDKLPNNRLGVVDRHTSQKTCLSTYRSSANSGNMHIHSPRETRVAQERTAPDRVRWCVKITRHSSVMSHPLQHVLFHLPHLSSSLSLSPPQIHGEWRIH